MPFLWAYPLTSSSQSGGSFRDILEGPDFSEEDGTMGLQSTHTHTQQRHNRESRSRYLPVCVHARSPVCVGGPKHTRVVSWVKVCVCLCAGRWVVAFQRARPFN